MSRTSNMLRSMAKMASFTSLESLGNRVKALATDLSQFTDEQNKQDVANLNKIAEGLANKSSSIEQLAGFENDLIGLARNLKQWTRVEPDLGIRSIPSELESIARDLDEHLVELEETPKQKSLLAEVKQQYDADDFDVAQAVYWYLDGWHGSQASESYQAYSTLPYKPGRMEEGPEEGTSAFDLYTDLMEAGISAESKAISLARALT